MLNAGIRREVVINTIIKRHNFIFIDFLHHYFEICIFFIFFLSSFSKDSIMNFKNCLKARELCKSWVSSRGAAVRAQARLVALPALRLLRRPRLPHQGAHALPQLQRRPARPHQQRLVSSGILKLRRSPPKLNCDRRRIGWRRLCNERRRPASQQHCQYQRRSRLQRPKDELHIVLGVDGGIELQVVPAAVVL